MTKVAIIAIITLAAIAAAVPPGALGAHCTGGTTSQPLFKYDNPTTGKTHYVVLDNRNLPIVYEETGVKSGLQRGGFLAGDSVDDTCHGRMPADVRVA